MWNHTVRQKYGRVPAGYSLVPGCINPEVSSEL